MLGLGTGIIRSALRSPIVYYNSDFSSDANGWTAWSVQDSASDLTLSANANPYTDLGGSAPNSSGWLKGVYGVNQTNQSGIQIDVSDSPISVDTVSGDIWNITGDLYIDCSGFKRLLIGNNNFKSYENELLVNRAITFNIEDKIIKL